jgi:hypothetical protein
MHQFTGKKARHEQIDDAKIRDDAYKQQTKETLARAHAIVEGI